jgi:hypothetical protein
MSKGLVGVLSYNTICSRHDIAEILLKLELNTNQSIKQLYTTEALEPIKHPFLLLVRI